MIAREALFTAFAQDASKARIASEPMPDLPVAPR
jgi:hypothetical protein